MVKILLHGCNGAMGQAVSEIVKGTDAAEIAAGVDVDCRSLNGYPVYENLAGVAEEADVIVDFAAAAAVDGLLRFAEAKRIPLVLCTTGLSDAQLARVRECAGYIAVLRSANMSLGVNLLLKLVQDAARVLAASGFDVEVVEKHHNRKLDAPSGTALALAESVNEAADGSYHFVYDRHDRHEKRDPKEIGISSVRGGSIVGEHDVIFVGPDEVVTLSHTAYSRAVFAKGAVEAALFLAGRPAGLYSMADVIAAQNQEK